MERKSIITMMIPRRLKETVEERLEQFPAVALLSSRQTGKTILAGIIAQERSNTLYLDIEAPSDQAKLVDPEMYLSAHQDKLVIIDEVQRISALFVETESVLTLRARASAMY